MSNPFYQAMGGNVNPLGNFGQLVQKFQQFKTSFQGDPKAEVEKMLQSGALTQEQLNRAQAMARQFQTFCDQYRGHDLMKYIFIRKE